MESLPASLLRAPLDFWNQRYSQEGFVYGCEADDFLREQAAALNPGEALYLAEGMAATPWTWLPLATV